MTNIRLLPVVIMAVSALLVLKTVGLVTNGGYVLGGATVALAAGGSEHAAPAGGETLTLPSEPTIEDATPTLSDGSPTIGAASSGGHDAPAASHAPTAAPADAAHAAVEVAAQSNSIVADNECAPVPVLPEGGELNPDGELTVLPTDCPFPQDALPQLITAAGTQPMATGNTTMTEQVLLERLATRRTELEGYEQELAMRASLVEAAEQRIAERQETLQSIEAQIASLVEQRKAMEEGQFAGIVAMYETMKPKDAANIFNALDIEVLLRVAKMMPPRKMAPILAEMNTARAQELTVRMASDSVDPLEQMTPQDLAALPQIVGQ